MSLLDLMALTPISFTRTAARIRWYTTNPAMMLAYRAAIYHVEHEAAA